MRQSRQLRAIPLAAAAMLLAATVARGQVATRPAWGRVSFFTNASSTAGDGASSTFSELIGTVTFESPSGEQVHYEYRADLRFAGYPGSTDRTRRVSIYDAYFGARFAQGTLGVRAGQMWLNELGGLGSVGGGLFEMRQARRGKQGRWRAAAFGGFEPKVLDPGYVNHVMKAGGYVAFDGEGLRRHVAGFVTLRDQGVTERSVVVLNNLLPLGKRVFVYQAAEYDVRGAGISGAGSLAYLFANARYTASRRLEIQASYHRGRSIDSRTIVRDQLDGRPVDPRLLDGLRFESANTRLTVTVAKGVRVYGGYGRDRNNNDSSGTNRFTYGFFAADLFKTGLDLSGSNSQMQRPGGSSYNSYYLSLGRSVGRGVYLTADYGSSLSVLRFVTSSGFLLESRPQSTRYAMSAVVNLKGGASILTTAERVDDGPTATTRILSGLSYRF